MATLADGQEPALRIVARQRIAGRRHDLEGQFAQARRAARKLHVRRHDGAGRGQGDGLRGQYRCAVPHANPYVSGRRVPQGEACGHGAVRRRRGGEPHLRQFDVADVALRANANHMHGYPGRRQACEIGRCVAGVVRPIGQDDHRRQRLGLEAARYVLKCLEEPGSIAVGSQRIQRVDTGAIFMKAEQRDLRPRSHGRDDFALHQAARERDARRLLPGSKPHARGRVDQHGHGIRARLELPQRERRLGEYRDDREYGGRLQPDHYQAATRGPAREPLTAQRTGRHHGRAGEGDDEPPDGRQPARKREFCLPVEVRRILEEPLEHCPALCREPPARTGTTDSAGLSWRCASPFRASGGTAAAPATHPRQRYRRSASRGGGPPAVDPRARQRT